MKSIKIGRHGTYLLTDVLLLSLFFFLSFRHKIEAETFDQIVNSFPNQSTVTYNVEVIILQLNAGNSYVALMFQLVG